MSASRDRIRRVYAATRELLDALHPNTGSEWIWRFRKVFGRNAYWRQNSFSRRFINCVGNFGNVE